MRCSRPHYTLDLGVKENGKRNLKFIGFNPDLSSLKQLSARYGKESIVPLPCGRCLPCRIAHSKEWAVRCVLESLYYEDNLFLTLTYDDAHLPADGLLQRVDVQRFIKRLRHHCQFRYFGCGEYGSKNKRPHYHIILFGCSLPDLTPVGAGLYKSKLIDSLWIDTKTKESLGFNYIGFVSYASCNYVAGYATKKVFGDSSDEFLMASTDPGIGYRWCKEHLEKVLEYDSVFGPFGSQKVAKMPRYFEKMAEALDDSKYVEVKARRLSKSTASNINEMLIHECDEIEKLLEYKEKITLDEFINKKRGKRL